MSLKKIRRRLSQTFRFSIESSLSELAEHLTIEESNGEVKNNGMHHTSTFTKNHRRLSLSHSRIIDVNHRPGKNCAFQFIDLNLPYCCRVLDDRHSVCHDPFCYSI